MNHLLLCLCICLCFVFFAGCQFESNNTMPEKVENQPTSTEEKKTMATEPKETSISFTLTSSVFNSGNIIPTQFTCSGANLSPPLSWTGAPQSTKSFAIICDDPDAPAGTWVHWVYFNIPDSVSSLDEGLKADETLEDNSIQGLNDFQKPGYGGPCPPPGSPHRYYFKLYALDTMLNLQTGAKKEDLITAMKGHILANTELMGTFSR